jgi:hypothetical protein
MGEPPVIEWTDEHRMRVGGTSFVTLGDERVMTPRFHEISNLVSTPDLFVLQKPRRMIDAYTSAISDFAPKNILEFGIFKGGSVALLCEVARPARYVAIELAEDRVEALDRWVDARGLADSVSVHYGVSQDDTDRVLEIVDTEFGGEPIDLIIDDASHALPETRTTFNALFPRLRAGGGYIIEDWALAEYLGFYTEDAPPLARLLPELITAWARNPDLFADVSIDWFVTVLRRGEAELDESFDVRAACAERNRYSKSPPDG